MNKKANYIALLSITALLTGCSSSDRYINTDKHTQLQIRQFQTRVFQADCEQSVIRALIDALQDEGYIIRNEVPNVGLVVAGKEKDVENVLSSSLKSIVFGQGALFDKHMVEEVTGNVCPHGKQGYKVRLVIQEKIMNNMGGVRQVGTIGEQTIYQRIFTKIDKSLFLLEQAL